MVVRLSFQVVWPDYTLGDVLNVFKKGKSHLGLVRDVNDSGEVGQKHRQTWLAKLGCLYIVVCFQNHGWNQP